MRYTTLFFDLDNTLYSSRSGLWEAIAERMSRYMLERLAMPENEIPALRRKYFLKYGTTLRGLQIHHQVDADEYLAYVHALNVTDYLSPQPELRRIIESLPQKRWIFTNADAAHAGRVLKALDLEGCFAGIIDIHSINFACKPEPGAYQSALELADEAESKRCVILDDTLANLVGAKRLGFYTVFVGSGHSPDGQVDLTLADLESLPQAMPELWEA
jgi:pyrimidine 5'-nucleotidase